MPQQSRFLLAVAIALTAHAGVAGAQAVRPLPPRALEGEIPLQHEVVPDMTLKVAANPQTPKAFGRQAGQVATLMSATRLGVPAGRAAYFAQLVNRNTPPVVGWHAFVEDIAPMDGGILVTVRVTALRGLFHDNAHLMEQYTIVDGQVNYVGAFEPKPYVRTLSSL